MIEATKNPRVNRPGFSGEHFVQCSSGCFKGVPLKLALLSRGSFDVLRYAGLRPGFSPWNGLGFREARFKGGIRPEQARRSAKSPISCRHLADRHRRTLHQSGKTEFLENQSRSPQKLPSHAINNSYARTQSHRLYPEYSETTRQPVRTYEVEQKSSQDAGPGLSWRYPAFAFAVFPTGLR